MTCSATFVKSPPHAARTTQPFALARTTCTANPGVRLGDNALINSRAVVEHDCRVGRHSHVATGAILCGGCDIGAGVHIGAGATLIQGITVGDGAIIAAGSVVTKDVESLTLVAGVPGRCKRSLND